VGILGAGMMGAGIALVSAKAGIDVVLLDTSTEAAARGKAYSEKVLGKAVATGKSTEKDATAALSRIAPTADFADLAGVDLVVEAVFEDTAIKADVTAKAEAVIPDTAIFASNTSTLPITQLAKAFSRPGDFIGLHFFSPVERMGLVEVIRGRETSDAALARALDFVAQLRKTPIVVNDSRGFYTSRVFQTFIHEGMELLREGVAPALIENGARLAGMPVGPLALLDEVSLELPIKIVRQTEEEDPTFRRPGSMAVLETLAEELGRPGRKGGAGFYDYPADGQKRLWPELVKYFPPAAEQPDVAEVKRRLLYVQALETARCLEEGVLIHPADGDLGAVFGWGFPSWSGGTLSLIETVGVANFVAECDRLAQRHGARFAPTTQLRDMAAEDKGFDY
jgi:3-hydroxyacyl-CoA dehydrogenase/enoyl-CoA hydratase/3-hydroxybutyryl-CoA epimerase